MEVFAGLSVCLLVLSALVIAVRTLALWRRTRGLPELLLGVMLVSATVIGYPLAVASSQLPVDEFTAVHVASQSVFAVGYACLMLFTLRVFRPDALWARCLAGATMAVLAFGTVAYANVMTGDDPRRPVDLVGLLLLTAGPIGVAYLWTTIEALVYHRRLSLRLRLGLSDPVVVNRMLLWGLMSLAAGIAVIFNTGAMIATGTYMSPFVVVVSSSLGLVHASCLFLAFHPPVWYRGWLEGRHAAVAG